MHLFPDFQIKMEGTKGDFLLSVKGRADLFTFLFFFGKQTNMANITDADKIAHYWAKQTATAISWSGGLQVLVALIALGFGVWKYRAESEDEDRRRERANALDRHRRRDNDAEDRERRRRGDEEDEMRRERMEKEGREAEERRAKAILELEERVDALQ